MIKLISILLAMAPIFSSAAINVTIGGLREYPVAKSGEYVAAYAFVETEDVYLPTEIAFREVSSRVCNTKLPITLLSLKVVGQSRRGVDVSLACTKK
jgi:hypothetical protein